MRHFDKKFIAEKYDQYRPQVHEQVIKRFFESASQNRDFINVADIACGTGHSTKPLLNFAENVFGTDVSEEMLALAKKQVPKATLFLSPAEDLPFEENFLDAIFVCMALHWFDQEKFISEVARTLKKEGWLFVYNMWFPGKMTSNPDYTHWHTQTYWSKFPNPTRHRTPLAHLLKNNPCFDVVHEQSLDIPILLSPLELRNYLMTQSNIDKAIDQGHSVEEIEEWIDHGIRPFFTSEKEEFVYATGASYTQHL